MNRKLTVSVSTIIRSTKFAVIISTRYLSCDSSTSSVIMTSDSTPAVIGRRMQREPEEIQDAPGEHESRHGGGGHSVADHDGKRDEMREQRATPSPGAMPGYEIGCEYVDAGTIGGTHDKRGRARK